MRAQVRFAWLIVLAVWLCSSGIVSAQTGAAIRGPITALWSDGERLLIGQGTVLLEARVTLEDVQPVRATSLAQHELRGLGVSGAFTLVLGEDGLSVLDQRGTVIDFVRGGGQRLAVAADRIYVAALSGGIRAFRIDETGQLVALGDLRTLGPALGIAPEGKGRHLIWVAEGSAGVRLYDAADPRQPVVKLWLEDRVPATAIHTTPSRLYIGYGHRLSVLDTADLDRPRLLHDLPIDDPAASSTAYIADLLTIGSRAFVGRVDPVAGGADVVALDVPSQGEARIVARLGADGAGEHLALHGDNLFVGSARAGLQRIYLGRGDPTLLGRWGEPLAMPQACTANAPVAPQPPDLGTASGDAVTLIWHATCAVSYELHINGTLAATLDTASLAAMPPAVITAAVRGGPTATPVPATAADKEAHSYTFTPRTALVIWQVIAIDAAGKRAGGPLWRFQAHPVGWLATPLPVSRDNMLYAPPLLALDSSSPASVLLMTALTCLVGLIVVVSAAWLLGSFAQRRSRTGL